ncbi:MAG: hypothetical protein WBIAU1_01710 [Wolbachia endosymbiont of Drosophila biauraria]|nr:MAG: hypothetical protein WBIAU1_01710 [Wolbachia endosymbiont of Drosophila biauraria]
MFIALVFSTAVGFSLLLITLGIVDTLPTFEETSLTSNFFSQSVIFEVVVSVLLLPVLLELVGWSPEFAKSFFSVGFSLLLITLGIVDTLPTFEETSLTSNFFSQSVIFEVVVSVLLLPVLLELVGWSPEFAKSFFSVGFSLLLITLGIVDTLPTFEETSLTSNFFSQSVIFEVVVSVLLLPVLLELVGWPPEFAKSFFSVGFSLLLITLGIVDTLPTFEETSLTSNFFSQSVIFEVVVSVLLLPVLLELVGWPPEFAKSFFSVGFSLLLITLGIVDTLPTFEETSLTSNFFSQSVIFEVVVSVLLLPVLLELVGWPPEFAKSFFSVGFSLLLITLGIVDTLPTFEETSLTSNFFSQSVIFEVVVSVLLLPVLLELVGWSPEFAKSFFSVGFSLLLITLGIVDTLPTFEETSLTSNFFSQSVIFEVVVSVLLLPVLLELVGWSPEFAKSFFSVGFSLLLITLGIVDTLPTFEETSLTSNFFSQSVIFEVVVSVLLLPVLLELVGWPPEFAKSFFSVGFSLLLITLGIVDTLPTFEETSLTSNFFSQSVIFEVVVSVLLLPVLLELVGWPPEFAKSFFSVGFSLLLITLGIVDTLPTFEETSLTSNFFSQSVIFEVVVSVLLLPVLLELVGWSPEFAKSFFSVGFSLLLITLGIVDTLPTFEETSLTSNFFSQSVIFEVVVSVLLLPVLLELVGWSPEFAKSFFSVGFSLLLITLGIVDTLPTFEETSLTSNFFSQSVIFEVVVSVLLLPVLLELVGWSPEFAKSFFSVGFSLLLITLGIVDTLPTFEETSLTSNFFSQSVIFEVVVSVLLLPVLLELVGWSPEFAKSFFSVGFSLLLITLGIVDTLPTFEETSLTSNFFSQSVIFEVVVSVLLLPVLLELVGWPPEFAKSFFSVGFSLLLITLGIVDTLPTFEETSLTSNFFSQSVIFEVVVSVLLLPVLLELVGWPPEFAKSFFSVGFSLLLITLGIVDTLPTFEETSLTSNFFSQSVIFEVVVSVLLLPVLLELVGWPPEFAKSFFSVGFSLLLITLGIVDTLPTFEETSLTSNFFSQSVIFEVVVSVLLLPVLLELVGWSPEFAKSFFSVGFSLLLITLGIVDTLPTFEETSLTSNFFSQSVIFEVVVSVLLLPVLLELVGWSPEFAKSFFSVGFSLLLITLGIVDTLPTFEETSLTSNFFSQSVIFEVVVSVLLLPVLLELVGWPPEFAKSFFSVGFSLLLITLGIVDTLPTFEETSLTSNFFSQSVIFEVVVSVLLLPVLLELVGWPPEFAKSFFSVGFSLLLITLGIVDTLPTFEETSLTSNFFSQSVIFEVVVSVLLLPVLLELVGWPPEFAKSFFSVGFSLLLITLGIVDTLPTFEETSLTSNFFSQSVIFEVVVSVLLLPVLLELVGWSPEFAKSFFSVGFSLLLITLGIVDTLPTFEETSLTSNFFSQSVIFEVVVSVLLLPVLLELVGWSPEFAKSFFSVGFSLLLITLGIVDTLPTFEETSLTSNFFSQSVIFEVVVSVLLLPVLLELVGWPPEFAKSFFSVGFSLLLITLGIVDTLPTFEETSLTSNFFSQSVIFEVVVSVLLLPVLLELVGWPPEFAKSFFSVGFSLLLITLGIVDTLPTFEETSLTSNFFSQSVIFEVVVSVLLLPVLLELVGWPPEFAKSFFSVGFSLLLITLGIVDTLPTFEETSLTSNFFSQSVIFEVVVSVLLLPVLLELVGWSPEFAKSFFSVGFSLLLITLGIVDTLPTFEETSLTSNFFSQSVIFEVVVSVLLLPVLLELVGWSPEFAKSFFSVGFSLLLITLGIVDTLPTFEETSLTSNFFSQSVIFEVVVSVLLLPVLLELVGWPPEFAKSFFSVGFSLLLITLGIVDTLPTFEETSLTSNFFSQSVIFEVVVSVLLLPVLLELVGWPPEFAKSFFSVGFSLLLITLGIVDTLPTFEETSLTSNFFSQSVIFEVVVSVLLLPVLLELVGWPPEFAKSFFSVGFSLLLITLGIVDTLPTFEETSLTSNFFSQSVIFEVVVSVLLLPVLLELVGWSPEFAKSFFSVGFSLLLITLGIVDTLPTFEETSLTSNFFSQSVIFEVVVSVLLLPVLLELVGWSPEFAKSFFSVGFSLLLITLGIVDTLPTFEETSLTSNFFSQSVIFEVVVSVLLLPVLLELVGWPPEFAKSFFSVGFSLLLITLGIVDTLPTFEETSLTSNFFSQSVIFEVVVSVLLLPVLLELVGWPPEFAKSFFSVGFSLLLITLGIVDTLPTFEETSLTSNFFSQSVIFEVVVSVLLLPVLLELVGWPPEFAKSFFSVGFSLLLITLGIVDTLPTFEETSLTSNFFSQSVIFEVVVSVLLLPVLLELVGWSPEFAKSFFSVGFSLLLITLGIVDTLPTFEETSLTSNFFSQSVIFEVVVSVLLLPVLLELVGWSPEFAKSFFSVGFSLLLITLGIVDTLPTFEETSLTSNFFSQSVIFEVVVSVLLLPVLLELVGWPPEFAKSFFSVGFSLLLITLGIVDTLPTFEETSLTSNFFSQSVIFEVVVSVLLLPVLLELVGWPPEFAKSFFSVGFSLLLITLGIVDTLPTFEETSLTSNFFSQSVIFEVVVSVLLLPVLLELVGWSPEFAKSFFSVGFSLLLITLGIVDTLPTFEETSLTSNFFSQSVIFEVVVSVLLLPVLLELVGWSPEFAKSFFSVGFSLLLITLGIVDTLPTFEETSLTSNFFSQSVIFEVVVSVLLLPVLLELVGWSPEFAKSFFSVGFSLLLITLGIVDTLPTFEETSLTSNFFSQSVIFEVVVSVLLLPVLLELVGWPPEFAKSFFSVGFSLLLITLGIVDTLPTFEETSLTSNFFSQSVIFEVVVSVLLLPVLLELVGWPPEFAKSFFSVGFSLLLITLGIVDTLPTFEETSLTSNFFSQSVIFEVVVSVLLLPVLLELVGWPPEFAKSFFSVGFSLLLITLGIVDTLPTFEETSLTSNFFSQSVIFEVVVSVLLLPVLLELVGWSPEFAKSFFSVGFSLLLITLGIVDTLPTFEETSLTSNFFSQSVIFEVVVSVLLLPVLLELVGWSPEFAKSFFSVGFSLLLITLGIVDTLPTFEETSLTSNFFSQSVIFEVVVSVLLLPVLLELVGWPPEFAKSFFSVGFSLLLITLGIVDTLPTFEETSLTSNFFSQSVIFEVVVSVLLLPVLLELVGWPPEFAKSFFSVGFSLLLITLGIVDTLPTFEETSLTSNFFSQSVIFEVVVSVLLLPVLLELVGWPPEFAKSFFSVGFSLLLITLGIVDTLPTFEETSLTSNFFSQSVIFEVVVSVLLLPVLLELVGWSPEFAKSFFSVGFSLLLITLGIVDTLPTFEETSLTSNFFSQSVIFEVVVSVLLLPVLLELVGWPPEFAKSFFSVGFSLLLITLGIVDTLPTFEETSLTSNFFSQSVIFEVVVSVLLLPVLLELVGWPPEFAKSFFSVGFSLLLITLGIVDTLPTFEETSLTSNFFSQSVIFEVVVSVLLLPVLLELVGWSPEFAKSFFSVGFSLLLITLGIVDTLPTFEETSLTSNFFSQSVIFEVVVSVLLLPVLLELVGWPPEFAKSFFSVGFSLLLITLGIVDTLPTFEETSLTSNFFSQSVIFEVVVSVLLLPVLLELVGWSPEFAKSFFSVGFSLLLITLGIVDTLPTFEETSLTSNFFSQSVIFEVVVSVLLLPVLLELVGWSPEFAKSFFSVGFSLLLITLGIVDTLPTFEETSLTSNFFSQSVIFEVVVSVLLLPVLLELVGWSPEFAKSFFSVGFSLLLITLGIVDTLPTFEETSLTSNFFSQSVIFEVVVSVLLLPVLLELVGWSPEFAKSFFSVGFSLLLITLGIVDTLPTFEETSLTSNFFSQSVIFEVVVSVLLLPVLLELVGWPPEFAKSFFSVGFSLLLITLGIVDTLPTFEETSLTSNFFSQSVIFEVVVSVLLLPVLLELVGWSPEFAKSFFSVGFSLLLITLGIVDTLPTFEETSLTSNFFSQSVIFEVVVSVLLLPVLLELVGWPPEFAKSFFSVGFSLLLITLGIVDTLPTFEETSLTSNFFSQSVIFEVVVSVLLLPVLLELVGWPPEFAKSFFSVGFSLLLITLGIVDTLPTFEETSLTSNFFSQSVIFEVVVSVLLLPVLLELVGWPPEFAKSFFSVGFSLLLITLGIVDTLPTFEETSLTSNFFSQSVIFEVVVSVLLLPVLLELVGWPPEFAKSFFSVGFSLLLITLGIVDTLPTFEETSLTSNFFSQSVIFEVVVSVLLLPVLLELVGWSPEFAKSFFSVGFSLLLITLGIVDTLPTFEETSLTSNFFSQSVIFEVVVSVLLLPVLLELVGWSPEFAKSFFSEVLTPFFFLPLAILSSSKLLIKGSCVETPVLFKVAFFSSLARTFFSVC